MARKQPIIGGRDGRKANLSLVGSAETQVELLGAPIDRLRHDEAIEAIEAYVTARTPRQVATVNLDFLRIARRDPVFAGTLREADLALADGMPLVWASRLAGAPLPHRIAGVDLVEAICDRGSSLGWSIFLLGAEPGIGFAASVAMLRRHPGLRIGGVYSPPVGAWDDLEEKRIRDRIMEANPDVLLVALGAPRQDIWISQNKARLGVPVSVGVGCTFDVVCGAKLRAPRWMQRIGLEWAFRLITEPKRLWRRYLSDLPTFGRLMLSALRSRFARRPVVQSSVARGGAR
jgi:N-acetylglucosaminyldiphosphoundecaprenol N-acetyl-beta-D-mannosaminyltransferase